MADENQKNQSEEFEREPVPNSKLKGWKRKNMWEELSRFL